MTEDMRGVRYTRIQIIAAVAAIVILLALVFPRPVRNAYEHTAFMIAPSAARAAEYGKYHFSSVRPSAYDITRAQYFYEKAATLDAEYPYVYHQLARIEFLKGNFNTAIFYINKQIELHGDTAPNSFYVRGLIEGYMGRYTEAAEDYKHYLSLVPPNWAGINDYAWVLLKADRFKDAVLETDKGLALFPDNPWLLNSSAIALYETGDLAKAKLRAEAAVSASLKVTEREWLTAYPGNDPRVARDGIATLRKSTQDNMHMIEEAIASNGVQ